MVRTRPASDRMVEVEVADSARGILDQDLNRLFEPFYSTKAEGLGMGLSISRSIIRSHGGSLVASQGSQGGLSFRFNIPAAEAD